MTKKPLSTAKRAALAKAWAARRRLLAEARKKLLAPKPFRSVGPFLDSVRGIAQAEFGRQADLARYLGTPSKSVSRWLRREQYPRQETIWGIERWYRRHLD